MSGRQGLVSASISRRTAALAIDTILVGICFVPLYALGIFDPTIFQTPGDWYWTEWSMKFWLESPMTLLTPLGCFLISAILFGSLQEFFFQRTIGGRICHLKVTDRDGRPLSALRQLIRAVGVCVNIVTVGFGFLWIFVDPQNRGFHDLISGSLTHRFPLTTD
jgi:uncharacterized RDD family membrane protein YckC